MPDEVIEAMVETDKRLAREHDHDGLGLDPVYVSREMLKAALKAAGVHIQAVSYWGEPPHYELMTLSSEEIEKLVRAAYPKEEER